MRFEAPHSRVAVRFLNVFKSRQTERREAAAPSSVLKAPLGGPSRASKIAFRNDTTAKDADSEGVSGNACRQTHELPDLHAQESYAAKPVLPLGSQGTEVSKCVASPHSKWQMKKKRLFSPTPTRRLRERGSAAEDTQHSRLVACLRYVKLSLLPHQK